MWLPQFDGLADVARVIAPVAPGFGGSPLDPGGWTVDGYADQLAGWLTDAGLGRVVLGGLSMGGYVALAFARRHPDRLRGLILADTKAEPDDDAGKSNRDKMMALAREKGAAAIMEALLPKLVADQTRRERPDVVAELKRIGLGQSVEAIVAALSALRDRPDATAGLKDVRVPTLVVVGAADEITPPDAARRMTAAIPGALQIDILAAGHMSNQEAPTEFNAAVRSFLTNLPEKPGK